MPVNDIDRMKQFFGRHCQNEEDNFTFYASNVNYDGHPVDESEERVQVECLVATYSKSGME